jgi:hypothetical protein
MLPSEEMKPSTMRKLRAGLLTRTPACWTSWGRFGMASDSLFCTCTCATSGSVPMVNVSVMVAVPSACASEFM